MVIVLAYSGIVPKNGDVFNVFRKLNFQNPNDVRNLNASIPNYLAGLFTAAENGFGGFGVIMSAENALLGSLTRDWGSAKFKKKLDLSSPNYKKNLQQIQTGRGDIISFEALQIDISETANKYREAIPESLQKIWEDFLPLLEKLNQPQFNKKDFQKEYKKFCEEYKSEDILFTYHVLDPIKKKIDEILQKSTPTSLFTHYVLDPIKKKIDEILQKSTPTSDDIKTIKEQLDKHYDVALRIVNKTDIYHIKHQVMKYNEVHLPPLLQFIEGFFIVDDKYDDIKQKLEIYKTIKDVREILFIHQENNTAENFHKLTPEQKESFKRFFCINPDQELTFRVYQEKIKKFFENQKEYVNGIIKNLDNCKNELEKENDNYKQIKEIDKLRSSLLDSIDRKKLPKLLEKPFLLQLFDSKSQTIKKPEELIKEIESSLTNSQKQKLALFYVGIGVLDFEEAQKIIILDSLTIDELNLQEETEIRKKIIIETALEIKAIKDLTVENLKKLCALVGDDRDKCEIIKKALEAKAIDLTVENLKELCALVGDDRYTKYQIIKKALEEEAIKDLTVKNLKELCALFGDGVYGRDTKVENLKEFCALVRDGLYGRDTKYEIITKALEAKAIKDLTVENLKELCALVGDDGYKKLIISKALENIEGYKKEEELTGMIIPPSRARAINTMALLTLKPKACSL